MSNYGKTIREIRQAKGLLQKETYQDVVAKSFAIRFEKGEVMLQYDAFLEVLQNLNVSQEEFNFIHNDYQVKKDESLWGQFTAAINQNNQIRLLGIYSKYRESNKAFERLLSYLANVVIVLNKDGITRLSQIVPEEELKYIQEYFEDKTRWTIDETAIFTNFYHLFPRKVQQKLMTDCYQALRMYQDFPDHSERMTKLLSSYIMHCYDEGSVAEGNKWFVKLQSLPRQKNEIYLGIRRDICGGYYYFLKGEYSRAQNLVDDACLALALVGYEREATTYRQKFKKFKSTFGTQVQR